MLLYGVYRVALWEPKRELNTPLTPLSNVGQMDDRNMFTGLWLAYGKASFDRHPKCGGSGKYNTVPSLFNSWLLFSFFFSFLFFSFSQPRFPPTPIGGPELAISRPASTFRATSLLCNKWNEYLSKPFFVDYS